MCTTCDKERQLAREWAIEVERRQARLTFAKQKEGEHRARLADHAAQHPYRYDGGEGGF